MPHKLRIPAQQLLNELRTKLQADTCCTAAALGILMQVAAGFALDAESDPHKAAEAFMTAARTVADRVRSGALRVERQH